MEKKDLFRKRMIDLSRMAYERNIVYFTNFLNLDELHMIKSMTSKVLGVTLNFFGGYESSERQIVAFVPDSLSYTYSYPIKCLYLHPISKKFSQNLTHRDYLGAILNLGINRNKTGDIIVAEDGAYLFCEENIGSFIQDELTSVKSTSILVDEITDFHNLVEQKIEEVSGTVASIRLDCIISLTYNTSRSSFISFIEQGKVFVNGRLITTNGFQIKDGDLISIRGKGKFRYVGSPYITKKGRHFVRIEKFT